MERRRHRHPGDRHDIIQRGMGLDELDLTSLGLYFSIKNRRERGEVFYNCNGKETRNCMRRTLRVVFTFICASVRPFSHDFRSRLRDCL